MATTAVMPSSNTPVHSPHTLQSSLSPVSTGPQDVHTVLHYYKANEDGSPPQPTYVDRPETYFRPFESHATTIKDVRGCEDDFNLDQHGFQFYRHTAQEEDFIDDDNIKKGYYAETEQLLKKAYFNTTRLLRVYILTVYLQYWGESNLHI